MTDAMWDYLPDALRNRIIEAVTWCAGRIELPKAHDCLRSVELRPPVGELINADTVERIVQLRRRLIDKAMNGTAPDGRLLIDQHVRGLRQRLTSR